MTKQTEKMGQSAQDNISYRLFLHAEHHSISGCLLGTFRLLRVRVNRFFGVRLSFVWKADRVSRKEQYSSCWIFVLLTVPLLHPPDNCSGRYQCAAISASVAIVGHRRFPSVATLPLLLHLPCSTRALQFASLRDESTFLWFNYDGGLVKLQELIYTTPSSQGLAASDSEERWQVSKLEINYYRHLLLPESY